MKEDKKTREKELHLEEKTNVDQYRPLFLSGKNCPKCNQIVNQEYELCPNCGFRLHSSHCTFCGAPMESDDMFCGECGGSVKGIQCPTCGTLSFRSFCPSCNQALDELAFQALEEAKQDPLYQRICTLVEEITKAQDSGNIKEKEDLPPHIAKLMDRYRQLQSQTVEKKEDNELKERKLQEIGRGTNNQKNRTYTSTKAIQLEESGNGDFDLSKATEELNALLASIVPPPGLTPQMQRNYYSARKVAVIRTTKVTETIGWICNLCGCIHRIPSECCRPDLGGRWIIEEKEITTKTYE